MAADHLAVPVLIGMGIHELSVSASSILRTRAQISQLTIKDTQELAAQVLECETAQEVEKLVLAFNKKVETC